MYTSGTLPIPIVSHGSVSSINILIIAQRYLSGVKRKTSVSAPSIICSVFFGLGGGRPGPSQGRLTKAERYVPRKHGWNLAPGQMGILLTRGGWNVLLCGRECCVLKEGGGRGLPLSQCQTPANAW